MEVLEVKVRRRLDPCPTCKGSGVQINPLWEEFWTAAPQDWTWEDAKKWWAENHGRNIDKVPEPEELECCDCEGRGQQIAESWVAIAELQRMLSAALAQPQTLEVPGEDPRRAVAEAARRHAARHKLTFTEALRAVLAADPDLVRAYQHFMPVRDEEDGRF